MRPLLAVAVVLVAVGAVAGGVWLATNPEPAAPLPGPITVSTPSVPSDGASAPRPSPDARPGDDRDGDRDDDRDDDDGVVPPPPALGDEDDDGDGNDGDDGGTDG